ncbi:MAG: putative immunity protein, partial [Propionicimonas sp.]
LHDAGYRAAAAVVRAAGNAAASVDDPQLARTAADYAIEALALNSAPCELQFNAAAERRWQWTALPTDRRAEVFEVEPPKPEPAACAIDLG